jgi:UDP-glucose 4-epimerase
LGASQKSCLIYGGGGFIGSHLAEELLSKGYEVTVFDKLNFSQRNLQKVVDKIRIIEGDFNNIIDIRKSLEDIDYVFHLVSSTLPAGSNENPVYDAESNLISSLRLFRECCDRKVKKVIFLSSGGTVYGIPDSIPITEDHPTKPICSYGIIKKTIEDYLYLFHQLHNLDYNVFRLSNPYGERQNPYAAQGAIAVFLNKVLKDEEIVIWGDGEVVRDYIYIKDAAKALATSVTADSQSKLFNLSAGIGYSLNQIIDVIRKVTGKQNIKIRYQEKRSFDVPVSVLDNSLITRELGWKPETSLNSGIEATYKYFVNADE